MKKTSVFLAILLGLQGLNLRAQDMGYFAEVPTADRVVQDMQTAGPRESAARASAALFALQTPILWQVGGTRAPNPQEAARLKEFERVRKVLMDGEEDKYPPCSGDNCERYKLHRCQAAYMFSPEFYRELFDRYFSSQWQSRYTLKGMTGIWGQALALPPGTKGIARVSTAAAEDCGETAKPPAAPGPAVISQRPQTPAANPSASGTVVPAAAEAYVRQGNDYAKTKDYANAVEVYKRAIAVAPNYPEASNRLGLAYLALKQYPNAVAAFQQTIRLKPDFAVAHYNLGFAYYELKQYENAVAANREALRLKPDYVEASRELGLAYLSLKQYANAVAAYQQAIRLKPDFAAAHYNLGFAYYELKQYENAVAANREALRLKPEYFEASNRLALAYLAPILFI